MSRHNVIYADCLEWMSSQPDDSVDLVFGSPPYEDARTYGMDFKLKGQDWVDWVVPRVKEAVRICKGLVAFVVEGKTRNFRWSATPSLLEADLHRAGIHLRHPVGFHRVGIPGSGGPDYLRNDHERVICCTSGGRLPWSDNTAMGHPPKWAPGGEMSHRVSDGTRRNQWGGAPNGKGNRRADGTRGKGERPSHKFHTKRLASGDMEKQCYTPPKKANPANMIQQLYTADEVVALLQYAGDVTHHKVGGGQMGSALAHENEAPFPESLAEFFVRSFCPPDGIAYDPFSGSGTVAAVCEKWGRRSIGTEIRESQVDLTTRRIAEVKT